MINKTNRRTKKRLQQPRLRTSIYLTRCFLHPNRPKHAFERYGERRVLKESLTLKTIIMAIRPSGTITVVETQPDGTKRVKHITIHDSEKHYSDFRKNIEQHKKDPNYFCYKKEWDEVLRVIKGNVPYFIAWCKDVEDYYEYGEVWDHLRFFCKSFFYDDDNKYKNGMEDARRDFLSRYA